MLSFGGRKKHRSSRKHKRSNKRSNKRSSRKNRGSRKRRSTRKHRGSKRRSRGFGSSLLSMMANFSPSEMSLAQSTTGMSGAQMQAHIDGISANNLSNFYAS